MGTSTDRRRAERLLAGLENGGLAAGDAAVLAVSLDPVLVYLIVRYLREAYPASDPAASSVLERVLALTASDRAVVEQCRAGEQDPVAQWFLAEHEIRTFRGRRAELIARIVDKLES